MWAVFVRYNAPDGEIHVLQIRSFPTVLFPPSTKFRASPASRDLPLTHHSSILQTQNLVQLRSLIPFLLSQTVHLPLLHLFHFPSLYLSSSLPLPEGRAGVIWKPMTVICILTCKKCIGFHSTLFFYFLFFFLFPSLLFFS